MTKRLRRPRAKDGELLVKFGKHEGEIDLFYCHPENNKGMRADCRMLAHAFENLILWKEDGRTLRQELIKRGYDITTFKFSIKKLAEVGVE